MQKYKLIINIVNVYNFYFKQIYTIDDFQKHT